MCIGSKYDFRVGGWELRASGGGFVRGASFPMWSRWKNSGIAAGSGENRVGKFGANVLATVSSDESAIFASTGRV